MTQFCHRAGQEYSGAGACSAGVAEPGSPISLCGVHSPVRLLDQGVGIGAVNWKHRHADAGTNFDLLILDRVGQADSGNDVAGDHGGGLRG